MHGIDNYCPCGLTNLLEIDVRRNLLTVVVDAWSDEQAAIVDNPCSFWLFRVDQFLDGSGRDWSCAAAPGCFDLEAIELGRVVRRSDHDTARGAELFHSPRNQWGRLGVGKKSYSKLVACHYLRGACGK